MSRLRIGIQLTTLAALAMAAFPPAAHSGDVVRPEEIKSMREVAYDNATYTRLSGLWKAYYDEYPSEFSYSNWMYAARYAGDKMYQKLLTKGLSKYPSNPTLLYLKALENAGAHDNIEGRAYLEEAAALDKNFVDPWFALIPNFMDIGDEGKLDLALRHLLEQGAIADAVMDYNYNMLIGLEDNAILITNGDNDTFPGWILTRILHVRPDVAIVNRAMLNADWYPMYVIAHGLPRFVEPAELPKLREAALKKLAGTNVGLVMTPSGPFGDTLVQRIIDSAERAGRPVYFSRTLSVIGTLSTLATGGRDLGLVTLVTTPKNAYADQLRTAYTNWLDGFRTAGLDSWQLRYAPEADAARLLMHNYADAIDANLPSLRQHDPERRLGLFHWYRDHLEATLSEDVRDRVARAWNRDASDVGEIGAWCKEQGL